LQKQKSKQLKHKEFTTFFYSSVFIMILSSLYDRLALHMLHLNVFPFSKWFQTHPLI